MLAGIVAFASVYGPIRIAENAQTQENNEARAALGIAEPNVILRPETEGFVLSVLCDNDSSHSFGEEEEIETKRDRMIARRNAHFEAETGAVIQKAHAPSVYDAAKEDALSGSNSYSLYTGPAAEELSFLLGAGLLRDVSDSQYIRTKDAWFDGAVMQSLSLYGKQYLISSSIADARQNTTVLVYDRELYKREHTEPGHTPPSALAFAGDWTVDALLIACKAKETETNEAQIVLSEAERFHGFGFGRENLFSMYVAAGGSFSTDSIVSLSTMQSSIEALKPLLTHTESIEHPSGFAEGETLFGVMTLREVIALKETNGDVGILPLPKAKEADPYRSYIDPRGATMLAIPAEATDAQTVEYLVYRLAFLSKGYMDPLLYDSVTDGDAADRSMLELILSHTVCDLSGLFGYGDIEKLVADAALGVENRLPLEYYNRKTLYEKALSILEKRLTQE